ncbi:MAG: hypothetical protein HUU50_02545 [Candidatus Brocadiae bacterium]|nr:hypothetical protein [Candidatus Brocadiia bacterium]
MDHMERVKKRTQGELVSLCIDMCHVHHASLRDNGGYILTNVFIFFREMIWNIHRKKQTDNMPVQ